MYLLSLLPNRFRTQLQGNKSKQKIINLKNRNSNNEVIRVLQAKIILS